MASTDRNFPTVPLDKPVEIPFDKPADWISQLSPLNKPAENPLNKPAENPLDKPAEPAVNPTKAPVPANTEKKINVSSYIFVAALGLIERNFTSSFTMTQLSPLIFQKLEG